jgi:ABC-type glycerol-3-phosphate transport system permease component
MRLSSTIQHGLANLIIGIALILFIVPLVQTMFLAVKDDAEIYQVPITILPQNVTDAHFVHVFTKLSKDFFSFFKNSVVVTTSSVLLIVGFGSLGAFGLSRIDFIGKRFIIFFISLVLAIPLIITVIPIFMMETALRIKNTNIGLILPYVAVYMPLPLFIMYNNFLRIPGELEESAYIDGANRLQIFWLFLPLVKAGLVAAALITFLNCWGEFLFALILTTKRSTTTLPIGIFLINEEEQSWALGPMSAVMLLSIIIPMTLYLFLQKYFVRGMTEGAIKG